MLGRLSWFLFYRHTITEKLKLDLCCHFKLNAWCSVPFWFDLNTEVNIFNAEVCQTCIYKCYPLDGTIVGQFKYNLGFFSLFLSCILWQNMFRSNLWLQQCTFDIFWHLNTQKCCSDTKAGPKMSFSICLTSAKMC